MKNLLKNGFIRREDLDFTDDGSRFAAYEYNGLVITKATYKGEYFICVRVDYLENRNFIYDDYKDKEWYKLCDEFNGTYEVDVDKLKANMDIIKEGIKEVEEEVKQDPIDGALMENLLLDEEKQIREFINTNKVIDITKYDEYDVKSLKRYLSSLQYTLDTINKTLTDKNYSRHQYMRARQYGYITFQGINKDFYCREITKILSK